jgi:cytochrome c oxidase assembly protein subunit 15
MLAACAQVSLGIATLLAAVPVWLGSAHQAGALTLFTATLFALHSCRVPAAAKAASRLAPRVKEAVR